MTKFFYIFIISMLFVNCTSNTIVKKPDNLIPKNEMVDILTDMFIANGGEHIKNIHQKRNVNYFPLIFEKYQIDSTQFKESNFYYISKIDDYDEILKKVEARLEKLKEENELTLKNLDSLKKNGELIYENQTKD